MPEPHTSLSCLNREFFFPRMGFSSQSLFGVVLPHCHRRSRAQKEVYSKIVISVAPGNTTKGPWLVDGGENQVSREGREIRTLDGAGQD